MSLIDKDGLASGRWKLLSRQPDRSSGTVGLLSVLLAACTDREGACIEHLGDGQWWTVPAATLLGIPLYSNASGVIPVAKTLLDKGLPVGTTLAFMMSVVAASFPEFVLLRQVMKPRLLLTFFLVLMVLFTLVGWGFNCASGFLGL